MHLAVPSPVLTQDLGVDAASSAPQASDMRVSEGGRTCACVCVCGYLYVGEWVLVGGCSRKSVINRTNA